MNSKSKSYAHQKQEDPFPGFNRCHLFTISSAIKFTGIKQLLPAMFKNFKALQQILVTTSIQVSPKYTPGQHIYGKHPFFIGKASN